MFTQQSVHTDYSTKTLVAIPTHSLLKIHYNRPFVSLSSALFSCIQLLWSCVVSEVYTRMLWCVCYALLVALVKVNPSFPNVTIMKSFSGWIATKTITSHTYHLEMYGKDFRKDNMALVTNRPHTLDDDLVKLHV